METNAKILNLPSLVVAATSPTTAGGDFDRGPDARAAQDIARYRLVIEEGPVAGTFVYKTLDSVTGEVVRQLPREQVLKMGGGNDYAAGGLIKTSA